MRAVLLSLFLVQPFSTAAFAQASPPFMPTGMTPDEALMQTIRDMPGIEHLTGSVFEKMDDDYFKEALLQFGGDCTDEGCRWLVFTEDRDGWKAIGDGRAKEAYFIKHEDGDQNDLVTDGIRWQYNGDQRLTLSQGFLAGKHAEVASRADIAVVVAQTEFKETAKFTATRYQLAGLGLGDELRLIAIGGSFYSAGNWGAPYLILGGDDRIVMSGVSADLPMIYQNAGGVNVVEVVPAGMVVRALELESRK